MPPHPKDGAAHLIDDGFDGDRRAQRVVDDGHRQPGLDERVGDEAGIGLVERLPIAAVNEQMKGRARSSCGKQVQRFRRRRPVGNVENAARAFAESLGAGLPCREDGRMLGDSGPDVVVPLEGRVEDHGRPRHTPR